MSSENATAPITREITEGSVWSWVGPCGAHREWKVIKEAKGWVARMIDPHAIGLLPPCKNIADVFGDDFEEFTFARQEPAEFNIVKTATDGGNDWRRATCYGHFDAPVDAEIELDNRGEIVEYLAGIDGCFRHKETGRKAGELTRGAPWRVKTQPPAPAPDPGYRLITDYSEKPCRFAKVFMSTASWEDRPPYYRPMQYLKCNFYEVPTRKVGQVFLCDHDQRKYRLSEDGGRYALVSLGHVRDEGRTWTGWQPTIDAAFGNPIFQFELVELGPEPSTNSTVRKRPFESAVEFAPYREYWLAFKDAAPGTGFKPTEITTNGFFCTGSFYTWCKAQHSLVFRSGPLKGKPVESPKVVK